MVDELTAYENVQAIADHICASRHDARNEIRAALSFIGLAGRADVLGRQLNLFERRLIEIAKTLVGRPKAILLDEPGAGLNDSETDRLRSLLREIPDRFGAQLVLIDHDADLDRVALHRDHGAGFRQAPGLWSDAHGARRAHRTARLSGDCVGQ